MSLVTMFARSKSEANPRQGRRDSVLPANRDPVLLTSRRSILPADEGSVLPAGSDLVLPPGGDSVLPAVGVSVLPGGTNADVIYLDDHATTRLDPRALEAMMPYLTETFGNPGSRHQPGALAEAAVASSRASVAELIGADRAEIIFTSGATEANYTALLGAGRARRGHIISSTDRPPSTRPV